MARVSLGGRSGGGSGRAGRRLRCLNAWARTHAGAQGLHPQCSPATPPPPSLRAGGRRLREAERGFTGTALTGLAPAGAGGEAGGQAQQAGEGQGQEGGIDMDAELAAAAAAGEDMQE